MKRSIRIRLLAVLSAAAIFAATQAFGLPAYAAENASPPASQATPSASASTGTTMNGPHGHHMMHGGNYGGINSGHMGGTMNGNNHHGTMMNGTNHGSMMNGHGTMMNGGTMTTPSDGAQAGGAPAGQPRPGSNP